MTRTHPVGMGPPTGRALMRMLTVAIPLGLTGLRRKFHAIANFSQSSQTGLANKILTSAPYLDTFRPL
jgi:hypothetical protein